MQKTAALIFILLSLALLAMACSPAIDLENSRLFQEAQERFNRATTRDAFLASAQLYQQILDRGLNSGAVLFNLGNAYMQADQRGRAIAAYRRAKIYLPRDPYLDANLVYALGTNASAKQDKSLIEQVLFWINWLSYPEKCRLSLAAASLGLALALAALFSRKKTWKRLRLAVLLLFALLALSALYDGYRFDFIQHGVIIPQEVVARKGNGDTWEEAFTQPLQEGREFRVLEERNRWLRIRLVEGPEGWIPASDAALY